MSSDFVIHPPNKTPTSTCLLSALQRITYPLPHIFCQIVVLCFCFPFVNTEPCSHKLSHACILYFSSIPVTNGPSVNSILTRDSCLKLSYSLCILCFLNNVSLKTSCLNGLSAFGSFPCCLVLTWQPSAS